MNRRVFGQYVVAKTAAESFDVRGEIAHLND